MFEMKGFNEMQRKASRLFAASMLLAFALLSGACFGQDSMWICAGQKADIPATYYMDAQAGTDLNACAYPMQKVLIRKIAAPSFWMCNFDGIGAPSGYVVAEETTFQTCGCRAPAKDTHGNVYCFGSESPDKRGWPIALVRKLPSEKQADAQPIIPPDLAHE